MDGHLSHPSSLPLAAGLWLAMVVAMMAPAAAPWVRAYATLIAPAPGAPAWAGTAPFIAGYVVVWSLYSLGMALAQTALAAFGLLTGDRVGSMAGAAVLVAAGAFQFTPLKAACLMHCRTPISFFLARWHDGPVGGFRLGLSHGAYCLGCCWLLMLTGLALGVMNLAWMAVLTAIVVVEQVAPRGIAVGRAFGVVLIAWGGWLIVASPAGR